MSSSALRTSCIVRSMVRYPDKVRLRNRALDCEALSTQTAPGVSDKGGTLGAHIVHVHSTLYFSLSLSIKKKWDLPTSAAPALAYRERLRRLR